MSVDDERSEVERRLAWLESQAHMHDPPPPPKTDKDMAVRLGRLQAEAALRRRREGK